MLREGKVKKVYWVSGGLAASVERVWQIGGMRDIYFDEVTAIPRGIKGNDHIIYDGSDLVFLEKTNLGMDDDKMLLTDVIKRHKSICWYPSAGSDFRPINFLNPYCYEDLEIPIEADQQFPDLFIMTDIYPRDINFSSKFLDEENISKLNDDNAWKGIKYLYDGSKTKIYVISSARLQRLDIGLDKSIIQDDVLEYMNNDAYGRVYYFKVLVEYKRRGSPEIKRWYTSVIYIIAENRSFARDFLLKNNISIDYISVIRYGESMGGGSVIAPDWIRNILGSLKCKYYICNDLYLDESLEDDYFMNLKEPLTELENIIELRKELWSSYYPIVWNKVKIKGQ